ncbi:cell division inhibitor SepF [Oikeobacillus pervagus]|uniref:Cell division protein SepF n=1 Tax=Oikeobacillus pervagus TaxID=1325931 RepID=A0AAJ1SYB6_9BACI|nr:cell division protein SepF [Oikeobacillus pervagus]MDQ0215048.1 cell division inhibitor SepF [Oikeobacillus pervagus]
MGIKSKFKTFFFLDEEDEDVKEDGDLDEHTTSSNQVKQQPVKQNVVSLQSVQKSSKVILIEPRVYAEAQEIADHLKNRKAVVVNLQRIQHDQAKRIVDFLSGTVYAIGGDIQQLGPKIFLCTPDNVEVSGNISQMMEGDEIENTRW